MDTPMEAILIARKGRVGMLRAIFGSSEEEKPATLTPQLLKSMFAR